LKNGGGTSGKARWGDGMARICWGDNIDVDCIGSQPQ
jgi:hypothetical protein